MARDVDTWVRNFDLTPASSSDFDVGASASARSASSSDGLFAVTSLLHPSGFPEAATKITVYRRYSQFVKLRKSLSQMHQTLYLQGSACPVLPKAPGKASNIFGGKDIDDCNEERRRKALEMLYFAAKHPQLYNSQVFVDFFTPDCDEGEEDEDDGKSIGDAVAELNRTGNLMDASALATKLARDKTPVLSPTPPPPHSDRTPTPTTPEEEMKDLPEYLSVAAEHVSKVR